MADSDGEYVHDASDDDFAGGGNTYGTRGAKGKGKGRVGGQTQRKEGKSWESSKRDRHALLREGADGMITGNIEEMIEARKRQRLRQDTQPYQRGIIRHLVLILDLSSAMLEKDFRPSRYSVTLAYSAQYIREFFEQNPISQMSIMGMHDGLCLKLSELSGNPNDHIAAVTAINSKNLTRDRAIEPKGNPSLQNALEMARAALYHTPSHGTREVVIILGALLTLDPGDIHQTIRNCVKDKLRISIIGMAGRLKICGEIVAKTNGGDDSGYGVAIDQPHFRELIMATTTPPVIRNPTSATARDAAERNKASLLMMGFPSRVAEEKPTLCACHGNLTRGGYSCSRCKAKVCGLPATCPSCRLTLILSTHLARSYHHLFPLRNWGVVSWRRARAKGSTQCKGCLAAFPPVPDPLPDPEAEADGDVNGETGNSSSAAVEARRRNGNKEAEKYQSASESSR
ncbi:hypothetical protein LTS18_013384, partial [Coniosporium uncinatum]